MDDPPFALFVKPLVLEAQRSIHEHVESTSDDVRSIDGLKKGSARLDIANN